MNKRFLILGIIGGVFLLASNAFSAPVQGLLGQSKGDISLKLLHEQKFLLDHGDRNRCPQKVGIHTDVVKAEMKVYPMNMEWADINTKVNPLLEVKAINKGFLGIRDSVNENEGDHKNSYTAIMTGNKVVSRVATSIGDSNNFIESIAELQFNRRILLLSRWSKIGSNKQTDRVQCRYVQIPGVKKAQSLASK